jgi:hypothetical protein
VWRACEALHRFGCTDFPRLDRTEQGKELSVSHLLHEAFLG